MTSAESSDATPGAKPLLQTVDATWTRHTESNAFDGHGAVNVDLESDNKTPIYKTVEEAMADAVSNGYDGFTYAPKTGQIWRLKTVSDPSSFKSARWAEVYVLERRSIEASGDPVAPAGAGRWCGCKRRRPASEDDSSAPERKKPRNHVWTRHTGRNAFDGYGAVNVDLEIDNKNPIFKTVDKAKADAITNGYAGFTYDPQKGRMWRLKTISAPWSFKQSRWTDVYVLEEWQC